MKKFLLILGIFFVIIIGAIVVLPIVFKDDIRQVVDKTMDESLNAKVFYDLDAFNLSLIKHFPDITVTMGDFGVVGVNQFKNDTLASIGTFEITVDLMSVISGDQIKVEEILLDQPEIYVLVLEDGSANYDIAKDTGTTEEPEDTGSSDMSIGIEKWTIKNGQVTYMDLSMPFYTSIIGLNHEGSGDFTLDVFDMKTKTTVDQLSLGYDGTEYMTNKTLTADLNLNMDMDNMKFTFMDNQIALNNFIMQTEGFVSMPAEDIDMDITFGGNDIDLKSILSLIPGVYQEYLDGVTATGQVGFDGYVKGTFNEESMPKVAANLMVADGKIAYADYNIPMEEITINSSFNYPSADLSETSFNVDKFSMLVDGESLSAYLKFQNLENYQWDLGVDGNADLEKIMKIVPVDGMEVKGKINAKLQTTGQMSDLEAEQYDKLPTSGSMTVSDFLFSSEDLEQSFGIKSAKIAFDPSAINLTTFQASSGSSDFNMTGSIENYLGFALSDEEILTGQLDFTSSLIDVNEFLGETEEEEIVEDTTSLEVVRIPVNIDLVLASSITEIKYSDFSMKSFDGKILVKDGAIILDDNSFQMLDGTFTLSGSYVTKGLDEPTYDLGFSIKDLSIGKAFTTFETIQKYVPIAEQVQGKFSTDFNVNGLLGSDMMPLMDEINLLGLVNIAQATLEKGKFVEKLSAVASLKKGDSNEKSKAISVKDVLINAEIKDGSLFVEPFDLNVAGQKSTVSGSNTLDGQLNYAMLMKDVSTGQIGNALNSALSSVSGGKNLVSDKINLNIGIGGNYDDPEVKLLGTSNSGDESGGNVTSQVKSELTSKVDDKKDELKEDLEAKKEEQRQKIISEAEDQAAEIRKKGKSAAEKVKKEGYASADKLIKEAGSNPIKKKVAEAAAKKLRKETDDKAAKVESEANGKADKLVSEAKAKAAKI
ncbi:MAG: AsmA-like C-terminal region-containing protein [Ekhidna sp.]